MLIKSLNRVVAKVSGKVPLQTVLIVPFIVQIVGAVGLVGYLSFRNGQQAVNDVASQLRREISDRTSDRIRTYLAIPHLINLTNADAIRLGELDIKNPQALERHFLKQIQVFNSLSRIYFSSPQGGLASVGHDERGLTVAFTENFTRGVLRVNSVDSQGNRQKLLSNQQNYDARERPFYKQAVDVGKPTWCPIYIYVPTSRGLGLAASYPFYDETGKLQGVLSSDLSLVAISNFLHTLKIGTHGEAFIIERSGMMVASSSSELPFVSSADGKETKRLKAAEIRNPLIRATAQHLISHFGNLTNINVSKQLDFEIEGKRQFAQVTPFKDELGLDWLIVVVVPEADFMEQINTHNHTTILLCITAFMVATGIGVITARWVTKPILRLNTAAKEITKGKWDKTVETKRSDEVGQLAKTFSQMAEQLQDSFAELTSLNEALRTSDRKFRAIFNQTFQFTGMLSLDGILLEVNQTALSFGGLQRDDVIGKPLWDCYWWTICQETQIKLQAAINRAARGELICYEVDVLGADHRVVTIDFSLKPIFDENGNVEFLILEGRDITKRKQAQQILADYNRTLEIQVAERTAELIHINEQLKLEISERHTTELALKKQKEILQTIFDNIPIMLCFYNAEFEVQFINKAFESTLGWSLEEMRAIDIMAQCYPDRDYQAEVSEFMMRADGTWRDVQLRTRTGNILFTSWANVRLPDGSTVGIGKDITQRKRAEEAQRENALRERAIATVLQKMRQTLDINTIFSATTCELRHVLNCDRVAIYRFNPDWSGEFVAESVVKGWVPLIAEQKNDSHLTEDALEDSNCIVKTLNIENDSVQDTYLQNTRGGTYSQGVNYRVTQDIYQAGFTSCYIKLLERFQVRAYIIVPIFCGSQLWGLLATYQNSAPRAWSESQISAVVQIGVQLGVALQQAHLLQHTQQQAIALELALDELKRTQSQLIQAEKMSSLGQMVAGVAHEINNPVSFIYGNLAPARYYFQDLLSLTKLYQQTYPQPTPEIQQLESEIEVDFLVEDWQKLIDSIQLGAERIREIVLSLRNFSRLDEKELKAVDIHEGIDNTLLILQHRLKADGVHPEIKVIKNYGQLPLVTCYASQLNQVFMNILSNAIDALETQASPRSITISTSLSQKSTVKSQNETEPILNPQSAIIRIADNGIGMSEAVKEKIFDPFFTTKPVGSGTGLGLSISYQIVVEKHKGQISCISTPGEGTEFIVEIPVSLTALLGNHNS